MQESIFQEALDFLEDNLVLTIGEYQILPDGEKEFIEFSKEIPFSYFTNIPITGNSKNNIKNLKRNSLTHSVKTWSKEVLGTNEAIDTTLIVRIYKKRQN